MPALTVVCDGCGATAGTDSTADPDGAVTCAEASGCCQADHGPGGHAGDVCDRTVTIYANAALMGRAGQ